MISRKMTKKLLIGGCEEAIKTRHKRISEGGGGEIFSRNKKYYTQLNHLMHKLCITYRILKIICILWDTNYVTTFSS